MTATAESRFSFDDEHSTPGPDDNMVIEYIGRGKYGVFLRHAEWKQGDPAPTNSMSLKVQDRLYCLALLGPLASLVQYCTRLQPILAPSKGVWVSEVVQELFYDVPGVTEDQGDTDTESPDED